MKFTFDLFIHFDSGKNILNAVGNTAMYGVQFMKLKRRKGEGVLPVEHLKTIIRSMFCVWWVLAGIEASEQNVSCFQRSQKSKKSWCVETVNLGKGDIIKRARELAQGS